MTPSYLHYVRVRNELIHREVRFDDKFFFKESLIVALLSGPHRLVQCLCVSIVERAKFLAGDLAFSMARRTSCFTPDGFISFGGISFFPVLIVNHTQLLFALDDFDYVVCNM